MIFDYADGMHECRVLQRENACCNGAQIHLPVGETLKYLSMPALMGPAPKPMRSAHHAACSRGSSSFIFLLYFLQQDRAGKVQFVTALTDARLGARKTGRCNLLRLGDSVLVA